MPLGEIPPNILRSTSEHNGHKSLERSSSRASFHARPPPLAVQNMLKSSTETGELGMFAQRPPRISRSTTHSMLRSYSRDIANSTLLPSKSSDIYHGPRSMSGRQFGRQTPSGVRRQTSTRSNMSAYQYRSHGHRHPAGQSLYPRRQGQHQVPTKHSEQPYLHSYRSLASLRSNHTGFSTRNAHYPVRMSSPAIGSQHDFRPPPKSRHSSLRTDQSSPGSMMSIGTAIQDYRFEHNRSITSLRPLPSPSISLRRYPYSGRNSFPRTTTPRIVSSQNERPESAASFSSVAVSPTDSIVPFYYDYSESFHVNEGGFFPLVEEPATANDVCADESRSQDGPISSAQSPFGTRLGSKLSPAELPTKHNRRHSEHTVRHSRKTSSKSNWSVRVPSERPIEEENLDARPSPASQDLIETEPRHKPEFFTTTSEGPEAIAPVQPTSPRNWCPTSASTFFTNASRSPRNLSDLAARAHSPDLNMNELRSIDALAIENKLDQTEKHGKINTQDSPPRFQLPKLKFKPLSFPFTPDVRPFTSPLTNTRATPEIVSPRPERPTSSQSRKRFSKILDADQAAIIDSYTFGTSRIGISTNRLESVHESNVSIQPADESSWKAASTGRKADVENDPSVEQASSVERLSGVTSHDKSTVDSLLERHIECLGLHSGDLSKSTNHGAVPPKDAVTDELRPKFNSVCRSLPKDEPSTASSSRRPTSLTSSANERLIPRRLFATFNDSHAIKFPFASSESDPRFSLAWSTEKDRPSFGWMTLPSRSDVNNVTDRSRQTLLSGDYADVESEDTIRKLEVRRKSTSSITPVSQARELSDSPAEHKKCSTVSPCPESTKDVLTRNDSRRHRKLKIHLKTHHSLNESSDSGEWTTTNEKTSSSEHELQRLGMSRVPISIIDGFAELSGESTNPSLQQLPQSKEYNEPTSPATLSNIVDAMPMSGAGTAGTTRKDSIHTTRSDQSKRAIMHPTNNSRRNGNDLDVNSGISTQAPRLAQLDLGPAMRASQFDLSSANAFKSTIYKSSVFSEPKDLLKPNPAEYTHQSLRGRKHFLFRRRAPTSLRSYTFSPPPPDQKYQSFVISHACQVPRPASFSEQPVFPDTVAMSDFSYRKYRLLDRLKEWCRRRCVQRPFVARRQRSFPSQGFIV